MKPKTLRSPNTRQAPVDTGWEGQELLPGHKRIRLAAALDDFLDEEVMDKHGKSLGTLECYWEGADGRLVFCGVKMTGQEAIRVVPGNNAQFSERHSLVRVAFSASKITTAPKHDCDQEVDIAFERAVNKHYEIEEAEPNGVLRYQGTSGKNG